MSAEASRCDESIPRSGVDVEGLKRRNGQPDTAAAAAAPDANFCCSLARKSDYNGKLCRNSRRRKYS